MNIYVTITEKISFSIQKKTPFTDVLFVYIGGAKEDRTPDLLNAIQALSQLSYNPDICIAGSMLSIYTSKSKELFLIKLNFLCFVVG